MVCFGFAQHEDHEGPLIHEVQLDKYLFAIKVCCAHRWGVTLCSSLTFVNFVFPSSFNFAPFVAHGFEKGFKGAFLK